MEFAQLNNGLKIPVIGFGTYSLYGKECEKCVSQAIELGYQLIDTAQMYDNEKAVGNAIKHFNRKELFITTKLFSPNAGYEKAKAGIEKSLNELQTHYIDLLLIHEPYVESLSMYQAMREACEKGKIRSIGISNFNKQQYLDFIKVCETIPVINQVECHVFYRQKKLQDILEINGTLMQGWSPLAAGKNNFFTNIVLKTIGEKYGKNPAQIGLRYLIQSGVSVIPKSANIERIKGNIDIFDFSLSKEDMLNIMNMNNDKTLFGWYK